MDVIEIARQLGAALQETEEYKSFVAARERNEKDELLNTQVSEINLIKMNYENETQKDEPDKDKLEQLDRDFMELYKVIMSNENMKSYQAASAALDAVCDRIHNIILMCQHGEDPATCEPSSCTGNCGTCGGCH